MNSPAALAAASATAYRRPNPRELLAVWCRTSLQQAGQPLVSGQGSIRTFAVKKRRDLQLEARAKKRVGGGFKAIAADYKQHSGLRSNGQFSIPFVI